MAGSIGLVKAVSAELKERNAFVAIFRKNALFSFEGCVQFRVLAGLVEVEGHVIKPGPAYLELFSPAISSLLLLSSLNPVITRDAEFDPFLEPLRHPPVILYSSREAGGDRRRGLGLDLDKLEIQQLNTVIRSRGWTFDVAAIAVIEELKSCVVQALIHAPKLPPVFTSHSTLLPNFKPVGPDVTRSKSLAIPETFRKIAWDIMVTGDKSPVVMVCGEQNTGKSTLCRFITNYLLNRFREVCFLECDVGQPELTIPGVISLHQLDTHLHGPPFTHLRVPKRAFYFGDISPKHQPDFYIRLIQQCMEYYRDSVLAESSFPHPLMVNTCGWVSDIGYPLFLDVVRTVKPTHIIQLRTSCVIYQHQIPPLSHGFLSSAPGWCLQAQDPTPPQQLVRDVALFSEVVTGKAKGVTRPDSPIMISSDEEEARVISISSDIESEEEMEEKKEEERKRKHESGYEEREANGEPEKKKQHVEGRSEELEGEREMEEGDQKWFIGRDCTMCSLVLRKAGITPQLKNSKLLRHLSYMSYFSPLLESLSSSSMVQNFILASCPYEVSWSRLAVHSLHKKVPPSQMLYVINGNFVGLAIVPEEELVDHGDKFPGIVKFVKSSQPVAEFVGFGLVRGIDTERKKFLITTPEPVHRLSLVNCLLAGNTVAPHELISQEHIPGQCPYLLPRFVHTTTGKYGYR